MHRRLLSSTPVHSLATARVAQARWGRWAVAGTPAADGVRPERGRPPGGRQGLPGAEELAVHQQVVLRRRHLLVDLRGAVAPVAVPLQQPEQLRVGVAAGEGVHVHVADQVAHPVVRGADRPADDVPHVAVVDQPHPLVGGALDRAAGEVPVVELAVHLQQDVHPLGGGELGQLAQGVADVADHRLPVRRGVAAGPSLGMSLPKTRRRPQLTGGGELDVALGALHHLPALAAVRGVEARARARCRPPPGRRPGRGRGSRAAAWGVVSSSTPWRWLASARTSIAA